MSWTYRAEYVRCGNERCKSCPHGPYWYRYEHKRGRMRKEYIGKTRPDAEGAAQEQLRHPWHAILKRATASRQLASDILGWNGRQDDLVSAFRRASMRYHPDRGGSDFQQCCVNAAYTYLKGS